MKDSTYIKFLWLLGKSGLGKGYIDPIIEALLRIIERQENNK